MEAAGARRRVAAALLLVAAATLVTALRLGRQQGGLRTGLPLSRATLEFAWPEFRGAVAMAAPDWLRALDQALRSATRRPGEVGPWFTFYRLQLERGAADLTTLLVSRDLEVYDPAAHAFLNEARFPELLLEPAGGLEQRFFGELLWWWDPRFAENPGGRYPPEAATVTTVDRLWPRGSYAVVEDLATGLRLRVLRRGGTFHADAEPATAADTAVLREIYGGHWSWRRRAVVVIVGGRRIAASANGMPHGGQKILDNGFEGHFCLHFTGSRLHVTGSPDRGHQLAVQKAAGLLTELLDHASPAELATWVLVGLTNLDRTTVWYGTSGFAEAGWQALIRRIRYLAVGPAEPAAPGMVAVDVTVYYRTERPASRAGEEMGERRRLLLAVHRPPGARGWKVRFASLLDLLEPGGAAAHAAPPLPAPPGC